MIAATRGPARGLAATESIRGQTALRICGDTINLKFPEEEDIFIVLFQHYLKQVRVQVLILLLIKIGNAGFADRTEIVDHGFFLQLL